jgi:beta-glucosidase
MTTPLALPRHDADWIGFLENVVGSRLTIARSARTDTRAGAGSVRASVKLANTGDRPALETVQAHVRDLYTSAAWADRELKTYARVWVEPGDRTQGDLELPASACSFVNAEGERVVEPGEFQLLVGPSSRLHALLVTDFLID